MGCKTWYLLNEAGQGTGPHAAAAAEVSHPAKQGLVQAFSVYIDTLFVCSATAFMMIITGMYNVFDASGKNFIVNKLNGAQPGPGYTQAAVESVFLDLETVSLQSRYYSLHLQQLWRITTLQKRISHT